MPTDAEIAKRRIMNCFRGYVTSQGHYKRPAEVRDTIAVLIVEAESIVHCHVHVEQAVDELGIKVPMAHIRGFDFSPIVTTRPAAEPDWMKGGVAVWIMARFAAQ